MTTCAPSSMNFSAIPFPKPCPPPVMMATLPESLPEFEAIVACVYYSSVDMGVACRIDSVLEVQRQVQNQNVKGKQQLVLTFLRTFNGYMA